MNISKLTEEIKGLSPQSKVELFHALGMRYVAYDHDPQCISTYAVPCNCVTPEPTWSAPSDVVVHLKETWDDRLARAEERQARRATRDAGSERDSATGEIAT